MGTSYVYDADGELLLRRASGDGETVLYLGATEFHLAVKSTTKTLSGRRYYTAAGQAIAVRTATTGVAGTKLNFLAADHHGTASLSIDAATLAITKRYTTPFGSPRGTKPTTWPDDKTFLGKPADVATGLTHIGAREYDPTTAQFISVDPLLETSKHQSLNGYSYAENAPVTLSDPSGRGSISCSGSSCDAGMIAADENMSGSIGSSGGAAPTGSLGTSPPVSLNGWTPGATFNLITQSWDSPLANRGNHFLQGESFGILPEGKRNPWETSRAMFFGWLWGMGWPLEPTQEFRGGDAFTAELASDETVSEMRSKLLGEAVADGMDAPSAKAATRFRYKDVGPDPGSPWYKANSIRGAVMDLSGVLTNGGIGTENYADAFLGSYSGTGKIKSVDREKGVVLLEFKVKNISDWNSATHAVPRHEKTPPIYTAPV